MKFTLWATFCATIFASPLSAQQSNNAILCYKGRASICTLGANPEDVLQELFGKNDLTIRNDDSIGNITESFLNQFAGAPVKIFGMRNGHLFKPDPFDTLSSLEPAVVVFPDDIYDTFTQFAHDSGEKQLRHRLPHLAGKTHSPCDEFEEGLLKALKNPYGRKLVVEQLGHKDCLPLSGFAQNIKNACDTCLANSSCPASRTELMMALKDTIDEHIFENLHGWRLKTTDRDNREKKSFLSSIYQSVRYGKDEEIAQMAYLLSVPKIKAIVRAEILVDRLNWRSTILQLINTAYKINPPCQDLSRHLQSIGRTLREQTPSGMEDIKHFLRSPKRVAVLVCCLAWISFWTLYSLTHQNDDADINKEPSRKKSKKEARESAHSPAYDQLLTAVSSPS